MEDTEMYIDKKSRKSNKEKFRKKNLDRFWEEELKLMSDELLKDLQNNEKTPTEDQISAIKRESSFGKGL